MSTALGTPAPGTHLLPDHALAHVSDHAHGRLRALPVDEEDAPQVHDQAHGPQEEQLPLGNLHAAVGEDLHEACGRRTSGRDKRRQGEAQGPLPKEKRASPGPWTSLALGAVWPLSLSFPAGEALKRGSRSRARGPRTGCLVPRYLPQGGAGPRPVQCQTPACQPGWVQPPPSGTAASPYPQATGEGQPSPRPPPRRGPALPIMSRMLWWLEMMTQGRSSSSVSRPLTSKRRPYTYLKDRTNQLMMLRGRQAP